MFHSSAFHLRKTKNTPRDSDYHERKRTCCHRFPDFSHMKLTDIIKSLRRRRLRTRREVPHPSPLTFSRSFPLPFSDHDSSLAQPPSPDLSASPRPPPLYRSDVASILSATEESCSAGSSTPSPSLDGASDAERAAHFSQRYPLSTFPTSPSMFQLRSASSEDYLVERLGQRLRRLDITDTSPDHVARRRNVTRDILTPMEVCLNSPNKPDLSLHDSKSSSRRAFPGCGGVRDPSLRDQSVIPMIVITSVDAKHTKPLPPSDPRPLRTPFGSSNLTNRPTNIPSANSKLKVPPDDPFTTQPHGFAYPPNFNLTFRLPSLPPSYPTPAQYDPETPTPMCCDHFGNCRGDLWEILHPPLVSGKFTLPPFELPPMNAGLFDDMRMPLSC